MTSWRISLVGLLTFLLLGLAAESVAARVSNAPTPTTQRAGAGDAFTVAVIPDTQREVFGNDPRLKQRNEWLVSRRAALDLRFVAQVGDLTNWGWLAPSQLSEASLGFRLLEDAGIPYSIAVGNHDTRAVGWDGKGNYGGAAYIYNPECRERFSEQECRTELLVRQTQEINAVFGAGRFGAVTAAYEPGKIDNVLSTFSAGGTKWGVLDLELWPRPGVVAWANQVVAAHPRHNIIVNTHSYLTATNQISTSPEYGSTSPMYLWKNLVSRHRNIQLVVSGHTGQAGMRIDRGVHGNKVVSLRTNLSATKSNPVRLVTIDPDARTLRTRIVAPAGGETYKAHTKSITGMRFVRPAS